MRMGPARIATPVGALEVSVSVDGDVRVTWRSLGWDRDAPTGTCRRTRRRRMPLQRADGREALTAPAAARVARSIGRWLQGDASALRGLPLPAGTPWQEACWRAARRIPWGQTRTYLWLASEACRELGRPASAAPALARAAGQAMRRNPVPIIVPCHRVVSASGLGGYAGTDSPRSLSLSRKRWLLQLEAGRDRNPVDSVPRHAAGP